MEQNACLGTADTSAAVRAIKMKPIAVRNALQVSHPTDARRTLVCLILIILYAAEPLLAQ
ncbi:MAG: hypothetical protein WA847_21260 [Terriglobales bacterium]